MMGWQPDVVCDNTHAQQITVHLRSIRPRKLAHVTDIFFRRRRRKTRPGNSGYCDFYFWNKRHTHNNSRRLRTTTGRVRWWRRRWWQQNFPQLYMFPPGVCSFSTHHRARYTTWARDPPLDATLFIVFRTTRVVIGFHRTISYKINTQIQLWCTVRKLYYPVNYTNELRKFDVSIKYHIVQYQLKNRIEWHF